MHKPLKIGSLVLDNSVILAPLAGITNLPFRLLAKEAGCGLVCSEMISANGLVRGSKKTLQMLDTIPEEKPLSVQIFGADPSIMAEAAKMVESSGASLLDINFGCSVKKVVKTGAGVVLMKDPERAESLLNAVRKSVTIPVTIKIRTGWDNSGAHAFRIAEIAEACGVDAIAVHPRTAAQGFRGKADWSIITSVKKIVSIPVIGNGDIIIPDDAVKMQNKTGCDGIMIGRAAIGNPWIFAQILALSRGEGLFYVDFEHRFEVMLKYVHESVRYFGEKRACFMMRSRLGWFVKGLKYSSKFRESIKKISSEGEAIDLLKSYMKFLGRKATF
ncbi:MAG: tRNA dihydrouridine synthase DusB [Proteobacteria bacterium]|nr:tRNA dihydrouridine synthase DusB [Pseudomonadota bacterium]MCG2759071.1 tRNA dihydrouridine synthase DusB [Desulfobacteraceae bacterium]